MRLFLRVLALFILAFLLVSCRQVPPAGDTNRVEASTTMPPSLTASTVTPLPTLTSLPPPPTSHPTDEMLPPTGVPEQKAHDHGHDPVQANAGHSLRAGPHIRLADSRQASQEDLERAEQIVETARRAFEKYRDYRVALQDGYVIFAPQVQQEVYHFINYREALRNMNSKDPTRPTALLYKRVDDGYEWVGVMYSAPIEASEEDLDERFPIGVGPWHAHVNICVPSDVQDWNSIVDDPKFGLEGSIHTKEACDAAGGRFIPDLFGWMVHVDLR